MRDLLTTEKKHFSVSVIEVGNVLKCGLCGGIASEAMTHCSSSPWLARQGSGKTGKMTRLLRSGAAKFKTCSENTDMANVKMFMAA